jgi:acetyl-CoA C-acetyltransferase
MKAIMFGAQSIMLGHNDIVMCGGMESMSNIPYYLDRARWGYKYGGGQFIDGLEKDGLRNVYDQKAMGDSADLTAKEYEISREEQDEFAILSYKRSAKATESGKLKDEIVAVEIPQRRGDPIIMDADEEYTRVKFEKIPNLRPVFNKDGTVTAANASTINDGASALVICGENKLKELGLTPLAEIKGFGDAAQDPKYFTTAPTLATPIALKRAGLKIDDMQLFEVNEAFAVVTLAYNKVFNLPIDIVNVNGGAVSIGHPLGASGARIVTTLVNALGHEGKSLGCAAICNGGGGASAMVIERL